MFCWFAFVCVEWLALGYFRFVAVCLEVCVDFG